MIEVSEETINRIHALLAGIEEADQKVLKPALTRGLMAGKTAFKSQITNVYYVTPKTIARYSKVGYKQVQMSGDRLIGTIQYAGKVIPLIKFNVTPQKATYGKMPVKAAVMRNESQVEFENAFTAQMPNGHTGVYERKGETRYPIKQLYGPSAPRMAENANVLNVVADRINEVINKRIDHEIHRLLSKNGG